MYRNIVVGFDASDQALDALALARTLRAEDGIVTTVCVTPDPKLPFGTDWGPLIESSAAETLARAGEETDDATWLRLSASPAASTARGLQAYADKHDADLLIVGSSHRGRTGRLLAGTTAQRLLNGAPCPVAVAPQGYRERGGPLATVGVAFDGTRESASALDAALEVAEATGASVLPICVVPTVEFWTGEVGWYRDLTEQERIGYRRYELKRMLEDSPYPLPADLRERATLAEGPAGLALAHETEKLDILFMGSRGYGPVRRVLLGGASAVVVRDAACPVVVLPRGSEPD